MASSLLLNDSSYEDVKKRLKDNPDSARLDLLSPSLTDSEWYSAIKYFNEDVVMVAAVNISITNRTLEYLVKKCRKIQYLKVVECPNLSEECMPIIGGGLQKLQSVHFEYVSYSGIWCKNVDVLSSLIKHCSAELQNISFIGFSAISDIGVQYAAECYTNTLARVNFNQCTKLTNNALLGIAQWCKGLIQVYFNETDIGDRSLLLLAANCKLLKSVNFGNCDGIGDKGIKTIAESSCGSILEDINVENCKGVSNISFDSVIFNCKVIRTLNFSGTSISNIPPHILALRRLKQASFANCRYLNLYEENMVGNVVTDEGEDITLSQIYERYQEYNVPYRLRVFFIGDKGSGKSSLIHSLHSGKACLCKTSSNGIEICMWSPLKHTSQADTKKGAEESNLLLECYDLPGKKLVEGIFPPFFTCDSLYVIVFNPEKPDSVKSIFSYVRTIQSKAPGSKIMVVGTHQDNISNEKLQRIKTEALVTTQDADKIWKKNIENEIENTRNLSSDLKFQNRVEELGALQQLRPLLPREVNIVSCKNGLQLRPLLPREVNIVSCKNGLGLAEVSNSIVTASLDHKLFHHIGRTLKTDTIEVLQCIYQLKAQEEIAVKWEELCKLIMQPDSVVSTKKELDTAIRQLHNIGIVLDIQYLEYNGSKEIHHRIVCVNPPRLADMLCLLHSDLKSSNAKLDIKRFWPRSNNSAVKRPDPGVLVKAMEDIILKGLLRQSVIPLLLQKYNITEDQILQLIDVLQKLGFLTEVNTPADCNIHCMEEDLDDILIPKYPQLQFATVYRLTLIQTPYAPRPHIHWTSKPHRGDIQVNMGYQFPNGSPLALFPRILALCHRTAVKYKAGYIHTWESGLLCKIGEVYICVEEDNKQINICCRTLADEPGQEKTSVQYMWVQLAPFLYIAEQYFLSWNGLFYKKCLTPFGIVLYGGVVVLREKSLPLMVCIDYCQKKEQCSFEDDHMTRYVDVPLLLPYDFTQFYDVFGWISYLMENRDTVITLIEDTSDNEEEEHINITQNINREVNHRTIMKRKFQNKSKWDKKKKISWTNPTVANVVHYNQYEAVSANINEDETVGLQDTEESYNQSNSPQDTEILGEPTFSDTDSLQELDISFTNDEVFEEPKRPNKAEERRQSSVLDYRNLEGRNHWQSVKLCLQLIPGDDDMNTGEDKCVVAKTMDQSTQTIDGDSGYKSKYFDKTASNIVTTAVVKAATEFHQANIILENKNIHTLEDHSGSMTSLNKRNTEDRIIFKHDQLQHSVSRESLKKRNKEDIIIFKHDTLQHHGNADTKGSVISVNTARNCVVLNNEPDNTVTMVTNSKTGVANTQVRQISGRNSPRKSRFCCIL